MRSCDRTSEVKKKCSDELMIKLFTYVSANQKAACSVFFNTECSCSPCGTESCDPHTGQCRCKAGVTGPRCDHCVVIFSFLNAPTHSSTNNMTKTCQNSKQTNQLTANKLTFHLRPLTVCQDGSYGFDSCSGCRQCDCDASAALVQPCDPQSGQCACRPGVNGPNCRQCAPGYWDYGPNGCKSE